MTVSFSDLSMNETFPLCKQRIISNSTLHLLDDCYDQLFHGSNKASNPQNNDDFISILHEASETPIKSPVRLDQLVDSPIFNVSIRNDIEPRPEKSDCSREDFVNKNYLTKRIFTSPNAANDFNKHLWKDNYASTKIRLDKMLQDSNKNNFYKKEIIKQSNLSFLDSFEFDNFDLLEYISLLDNDDFSGADQEDSNATSNFSSPCTHTPLSGSVIDTPVSTSDLNCEKDQSCSQNQILISHSQSMDNIIEHAATNVVPSRHKTDSYFSVDVHHPSLSQSCVHKSKNNHGDSEIVAKRVKHNNMEKLRRKHVTNAFYKLAALLKMTDGKSKKPSKANILINATAASQILNKESTDLKLTCDSLYTKRTHLLTKISSYFNLN